LANYNPGQLVSITTNPGFKNSSGVLTDPTTVTLRWRDPHGVETVWVYGTDPEITRTSAGIYASEILGDITGTYVFRWEGDGSVTAADEDSFIVESLFDLQFTSPQTPLRYLTPLMLRNMAFGTTFTQDSAELASLIETATYLVNSECNAPTGFDFRGGTVVAEEHIWDPGNVYKPGSGRVWPMNHPVKSASSLKIYVTSTQYVEFNVNTLFVNKALGYVEPVGLPNMTALFSAIPPWGLTESVAKLDYTYGYAFTVSSEVPKILADGTLLAANAFWAAAPTLTADNVEVDSGDYTYDADEGTVTITAGVDRTVTYRLSYTHKLPTGIARATGLLVTDLIGYANINAAGLSGLSGIRVEEIELRQSSKAGFIATPISRAVAALLAPYKYIVMR